MSIQSRLRNQQLPTPVSGRPRLFGSHGPAGKPLNLTTFIKDWYEKFQKIRVHKTAGAFGGISKLNRKKRDEDRLRTMRAALAKKEI
jgi:hypothetical protein